MSSLQTFKKENVPALQKELNLPNIHAVPHVDKVVVSIGIGSLATRKSMKDFSEIESNLLAITGQKPRMVKSKKSISNFKLREGMPVMLQVTLRKKKAYDFLDRLVKVVLPRIRDFGGISAKSFDPYANMNLGIANYNIFPEFGLDDVTIPTGMQITIVTTTNNTPEALALLKSLGFIFKG